MALFGAPALQNAPARSGKLPRATTRHSQRTPWTCLGGCRTQRRRAVRLVARSCSWFRSDRTLLPRFKHLFTALPADHRSCGLDPVARIVAVLAAAVRRRARRGQGNRRARRSPPRSAEAPLARATTPRPPTSGRSMLERAGECFVLQVAREHRVDCAHWPFGERCSSAPRWGRNGDEGGDEDWGGVRNRSVMRQVRRGARAVIDCGPAATDIEATLGRSMAPDSPAESSRCHSPTRNSTSWRSVRPQTLPILLLLHLCPSSAGAAAC